MNSGESTDPLQTLEPKVHLRNYSWPVVCLTEAISIFTSPHPTVVANDSGWDGMCVQDKITGSPTHALSISGAYIPHNYCLIFLAIAHCAIGNSCRGSWFWSQLPEVRAKERDMTI